LQKCFKIACSKDYLVTKKNLKPSKKPSRFFQEKEVYQTTKERYIHTLFQL